MHIVYLHGFNSGPKSLKAHETADYLRRHHPDCEFHCPQLSPHPAEAAHQAETLLQGLPKDTLLIGSSLGGFYATHLAEKLGLRAALINPAVTPHADLSRFLGPQVNPYTGEAYTLSEADMAALMALRVSHPSARRYWLYLGTRDEVLDWKAAARHYRNNHQTVFNGDDHRLARWPECLPGLMAWATAA
ncbi:YqiA/YcfP family alpha/beta fold hydrolase [uncultured Aquitalea sp.]|uniref:YqiA/YcfP family alpha/beta fold hydrolase n=1 Tax=uncultured Aquitalea sp. TaxID=540272 RepID=UPI0025FF6447|nr:YqiA/YcfP family alpha/beta fold hydrolase [uncultured Aquitalea sp.]